MADGLVFMRDGGEGGTREGRAEAVSMPQVVLEGRHLVNRSIK
jgi:hypothetical protein